MPFLGKTVGMEVGVEGPLTFPRCPADPALGETDS